jgi:hypothetical protein
VVGANEQLQGGRELNNIAQKDSYAGTLFQRVIDTINNLCNNVGIAAVGKLPPPPRVDSINIQGTVSNGVVSCPSEILHWTMTHNQSISKGIRYFSEIDTTTGFNNPHVVDHGTSRTGIITLPTFSSTANRTSNIPTKYYIRSYAQYPGSDPCAPTVLGGLGSPLAITMGGTGGATGTGSVTALLASTGSGTASSTGQQGGQGLGTILTRPAPRPKRSTL